METVECPDCRGLGFTTIGTRRDDDGEEHNVNEECPRCQGEGKLPEHDPELLLARIQQLEGRFETRQPEPNPVPRTSADLKRESEWMARRLFENLMCLRGMGETAFGISISDPLGQPESDIEVVARIGEI